MKVNLKKLEEIFNGTSKLKLKEQLILLYFYNNKLGEIIEKHRAELPKELLDLWDLKEWSD